MGTHHRLLCLTGEKKGVSYYISDKRVVLGRSEKADIQIIDEKASRDHAEIVRIKDDFILTDLKSQNGTVVEDLKISQHKLSNNDRIIIGSSVLKFEIFHIEPESELTVSENSKEVGENISDNEKEEKKDPPKKQKSFFTSRIIRDVFSI